VKVPVPDLANSRPPYLQIADDLRSQIESGRYQPGDKLPSLPEMLQTYTSAYETIRRAIGKLRDEGLVATQGTRGTFVLRQVPEQPAPLDMAAVETAVREAEARITRHVDNEMAKLREDLEFTQAQVEALTGTAAPAAETGTGR
jgi:GntR family transcriptional regulator